MKKTSASELSKKLGISPARGMEAIVTGILSGSLQKITIDRVLKLVEAAHLIAEVRVKTAA
ncbi:MAG: hypothetical protein HY074_03500 [Deltaproteobacteria bacterium]|nr:hypothetical protein [Deltaproteobacteria bacterium]